MSREASFSTVISLVALIISATTAYYELFSVNTTAAMIIDGSGPDELRNATDLYSVDWQPDIAVVNSGNRPFAILKMSLLQMQAPRSNIDAIDCEAEKGYKISVGPLRESFARIAVAPGSLVVLNPRFHIGLHKDGHAVGDIPKRGVPRSPSNYAGYEKLISSKLDGKELNLLSCIAIEFVDYRGAIHNFIRPLYISHPNGTGLDFENSRSLGEPIDISAFLSEPPNPHSDTGV